LKFEVVRTRMVISMVENSLKALCNLEEALRNAKVYKISDKERPRSPSPKKLGDEMINPWINENDDIKSSRQAKNQRSYRNWRDNS